jgi:hypothetical protein
MSKGHEFGGSGGTNGGVGRVGARRRAGRRGMVWEVEVPEAGRWGAMAKEDDGIVVVHSDGGSREGDITAGIAQLSHGDEGRGS